MTKNHEYFPVQFRIYSTFTHGKNKGKPNPETFHTVTLYRLIDYINNTNTESVGQTLKRAKSMIDETHTKIVLTNPGKETDWERDARREKNQLEVVQSVDANVPKPTLNDRNREEAGDTTFVAPVSQAITSETLVAA
jgi:hypothetical protein